MKLHIITRSSAAAFLAIIVSPSVWAQAYANTATDVSRTSITITGSATGKTKFESNGENQRSASMDRTTIILNQAIGDFRTAFTYDMQRINLGQSNTTIPLPTQLHEISVAMEYTHALNADWTGFASISPGWRTVTGDNRFDSKGFGVGTAIGAHYQYNMTSTLSFGILYNSLSSGRYRVLPFIGKGWKVGDDWEFSAGFPKTSITYTASKNLHLVPLIVNTIGGSYYVKDDPLSSAVGKPSLSHTVLEYYEIRIGSGITYSINKTVTVAASVGTVALRGFDYRDRNFKLSSKNIAPVVSLGATASF
jgi:hypothetical protein